MGTFTEEDESGAGGERCVGAKFSGMNGQDSAFRQKGGTFAQSECVVVKSQGSRGPGQAEKFSLKHFRGLRRGEQKQRHWQQQRGGCGNCRPSEVKPAEREKYNQAEIEKQQSPGETLIQT